MSEQHKTIINECILKLPSNKEDLYKSLDIFKLAMNNANAKGSFKILIAHQINVSITEIRRLFDRISKLVYAKDKKSQESNEYKISNLEVPPLEALIKINLLIGEALETASTKGVFTTLDESSTIFEAYYTLYQILETLISSVKYQENYSNNEKNMSTL